MIQVYKSDLTDLFKPHDEFARALSISIDRNGSPTVKNATIVKQGKFSANDIVKLVNWGLDNRMMRSTFINETSSRSHLLFMFKFRFISHLDENDAPEINSQCKITFVDLAGSERAACI